MMLSERPRVAVVSPPDPLITAADARDALGLGNDVPDASLDFLVAAATSAIDGPSGWLGRALGEQTLEQRQHGAFWRCSPTFMLLYPPLIAVESVTYLDSTGAAVTLDPGDYRVIGGDGATGVAMLEPARGKSWPSALDMSDAVRITYRAGYAGEGGAAELPAAIRFGIILEARRLLDTNRDLFLKREDVEGVLNREWVVSSAAGDVLDTAVGRLLKPFRIQFL